MLMALETDTNEIVNEIITGTRNFGRCGLTGVYVEDLSCLSNTVSLKYIPGSFADFPLDQSFQHWFLDETGMVSSSLRD